MYPPPLEDRLTGVVPSGAPAAIHPSADRTEPIPVQRPTLSAMGEPESYTDTGTTSVIGRVGSAISDGVPAAGAGNLKTKGSKDTYTFTVPTGGKSLFLDFKACASNNANQYLNGLMWQVVSVTSDSKVAGDYCSSGNKSVMALPAGGYRLEMTTDLSRNSWGTYSLKGALVA